MRNFSNGIDGEKI